MDECIGDPSQSNLTLSSLFSLSYFFNIGKQIRTIVNLVTHVHDFSMSNAYLFLRLLDSIDQSPDQRSVFQGRDEWTFGVFSSKDRASFVSC